MNNNHRNTWGHTKRLASCMVIRRHYKITHHCSVFAEQHFLVRPRRSTASNRARIIVHLRQFPQTARKMEPGNSEHLKNKLKYKLSRNICLRDDIV
jgi:hypothetical protein